MSLRQAFAPLSLAALGLALALGGCVAVPLAQMAASQMKQTDPTKMPGGWGDLSKGIGDSFHKLAALAPENPPAPGAPPAK